MALESALTVIGMSVVYSLTVYFAKKTKDDPETFHVRKFLRAVLVGVGVGLLAAVTGIEVTPDNVMHLASSYGIVGAADQVVKVLFRNVDIDEWLEYGR